MSRLSRTIRHLYQGAFMLATLLINAARLLRLSRRSPAALAAENLFLRKQLALYQEHHVKPRRARHATRITLLWLSPWFDWHRALVVVQPETFTRWRRQGFRLFRPWTSCCGRPPIPAELQGLIRQILHATQCDTLSEHQWFHIGSLSNGVDIEGIAVSGR
jgi:hypothetical protein